MSCFSLFKLDPSDVMLSVMLFVHVSYFLSHLKLDLSDVMSSVLSCRLSASLPTCLISSWIHLMSCCLLSVKLFVRVSYFFVSLSSNWIHLISCCLSSTLSSCFSQFTLGSFHSCLSCCLSMSLPLRFLSGSI